jgi:hypothetical protein
MLLAQACVCVCTRLSLHGTRVSKNTQTVQPAIAKDSSDMTTEHAVAMVPQGVVHLDLQAKSASRR